MDEVKVEVELAQPARAREIQARLRQRLGLRIRIVPLKAGDSAGAQAARRGASSTCGRCDRGRWPAVVAVSGDQVSLSSGPEQDARRHSISEVVAERIRVYMLTERLRPGDRLGREEDLARSFGVSRPTLREALRLLSSEHLIRASKGPGGGIFVAATPEEGIGLSVSATVASMLDAHSIEIDELLETRMLLEIPLAGLAAQHAADEDLAALQSLGERRRGGGERSGSRSASSTRGFTGWSRRSPATGSRRRSPVGSSTYCSRGCAR